MSARVTKEELDRLSAALNKGKVQRGPLVHRIPLTHPLPRSDSKDVGGGRWISVPWTPKSRAIAMWTHNRLATKEEFEERWGRLAWPGIDHGTRRTR